jgi:hypothetical protein
MAKVYNVYRVDYLKKTRTFIGTVEERRQRRRGYDNNLGLVKLARKIYGQSEVDPLRIVVPDVFSDPPPSSGPPIPSVS